MENQTPSTEQQQDQPKGKGGNLGNKSITNKSLTKEQQVEILLSAYAKFEASKAFLIAKGFSKEKQDKLFESDIAKERIKETIDRFSKESGITISSDKVDTAQSFIKKLLEE